jgi:predicted nucleic acid-binding Zn ribbon protein
MTEDRQLTEAVCRQIAARQYYRAGPKKIADVMSDLLARRGYARQQSASQLAEVWAAAVGESFAADTRAGNVRRGVLEIIVRHSALVQELTFRKKQLLQTLATHVPERKIRDLRFRVGPID